MYRFVSEILNDQDSSFIPDVAFHPDGCMFAVSYRQNNQIRVYDSSTQCLLRTYRNPEARLDWPQGVAITNRHIIVSNKPYHTTKPGILNVYRVGDPSEEPLTVFTTPVKHLREAHSFAVHNGRLLVTYCGKGKLKGRAIASYSFDDETGKISGPTSILESCFIMQRNPKGLCFNEEGTKVIVTFSDSNGMAIFDVDEDGVLSKAPVQTLQGSQFSRPENLSTAKGLCAIANTTNNTVNLYNYNGDHFPDSPVQVIRDHLSFPHDACLSPDKKMLVVSNFGLNVVNGEPQWRSFLHPRNDKLTFYELQE